MAPITARTVQYQEAVTENTKLLDMLVKVMYQEIQGVEWVSDSQPHWQGKAVPAQWEMSVPWAVPVPWEVPVQWAQQALQSPELRTGIPRDHLTCRKGGGTPSECPESLRQRAPAMVGHETREPEKGAALRATPAATPAATAPGASSVPRAVAAHPFPIVKPPLGPFCFLCGICDKRHTAAVRGYTQGVVEHQQTRSLGLRCVLGVQRKREGPEGPCRDCVRLRAQGLDPCAAIGDRQGVTGVQAPIVLHLQR